MTTPTTHDSSAANATLALIERFNDRFNAHDIDGFMALMADDCVFENTFPAPDGERYEGQAAVRGFWDRFFHDNPTAHFDAEDALPSARHHRPQRSHQSA